MLIVVTIILAGHTDDPTIHFTLLHNVIIIETSTHCSSPQVPLPPQVGCVGVTKSGRHLAVSWSAVAIPSYNISYVVVYSTDSGTKTDPPVDVVEKSVIKDTSTTLTGLQLGATYYVWVATKIIGAGVQGPYSQRAVVGGKPWPIMIYTFWY